MNEEYLINEANQNEMEAINNTKEWDCNFNDKIVKYQEIIIPSQSDEWWNYLLEFNYDGDQIAVYAEDKHGRKLLDNKMLICRNIDGSNYYKLVDKDYELDKDNGDLIVDECE